MVDLNGYIGNKSNKKVGEETRDGETAVGAPPEIILGRAQSTLNRPGTTFGLYCYEQTM